MTLPRRRSSTMPTTASKDTTKSKVVIPEGTPVEVVEQKGDKTLVYTAEIKEDEDQSNQNNGTGFEDEGEDIPNYIPEPPAPVIPKSPLDNLFDDINICVESGTYDNFIAKLLREPDNAQDRFNIPCRDFIDIGAFSFSSIDRFRFYEAIQDANDQSGGRFAVTIYTHDYKALFMPWRGANSGAPRSVTAKLVVMNPKAKPLLENHNTNDGGIGAAILELAKLQQQNHNQLMEVMRRPTEKSELEQTLMAAMVSKFTTDILNPPQPRTNGIEETMSGVMQSVIVTQAMAEGFAKIINREPPPEREPDFVDKFNKIAEVPVVKELAGRIMDIADAAAVKGLQLGETVPATAAPATDEATAIPNPQEQQPAPPQAIPMSEDQMELLATIVEELDGENPLDANNETIKELAEDYPNEFADLTAMCQAAEFDGVFRMLLGRAAKIQPFPFREYLDIEATQINMNMGLNTYPMPYVWNEQGLRLIERLKELHGYLKATAV